MNLDQIIKDAQFSLKVNLEILLERKINAEFNPTDYNLRMLQSQETRVLEKQNFLNRLQGLKDVSSIQLVLN